MSSKSEIRKLADYLLAEWTGDISYNESAVDVAIKLLKKVKIEKQLEIEKMIAYEKKYKENHNNPSWR